MIIGAFSKQPAEVLDYSASAAALLGGDTFGSVTATPQAGLTLVSDSFTDDTVSGFVGGGTTGQAYRVDYLAQTAGGRTLEFSISVRVSPVVMGTNSYISALDADEYFAARANSTWMAADLTQRDAALIKATSYLDSRYRRRWKGIKASSTQLLAWPRSGATDADGFIFERDAIPTELRHATAEAALRALSQDLRPDLARGGQVKSEKVGPIETTYADSAPAGTEFSAVDDLLSGLLISTGSIDLVRV